MTPRGERRPIHRTVTAPGERTRRADPVRLCAYEGMRAIDEGAYANLVVPRLLREHRLSGRDAALVTELVYGATRWRGRYDAIIARCAGRELSAIDPHVLDVLRLGAHQALALRIPAHAAVDTTVGLARQVAGAGAGGFVNAVLRRITEKDAETWAALLLKGSDGPLAALATDTSHPEWIVRALRSALIAHGSVDSDDLDAPDAALRALLDADNTPAEVTLVARPGLAERDELLAAGAHPNPLTRWAADLPGGDPGALPAVRQGRAAVQDAGSQLVVSALLTAWEQVGEAVAEVETRTRWLDLCAGPGGKAGLLAALSIRRQAVLFANELSEHRADLVHQAVRAAVDADAQVMVGVGDGRDIGAEEPEGFGLVLVDAPCTGLGALRRRPEARWRRTPDDVAALTELQGQLLDSAVAAAAPGGLIGYATCSPHPAETRYVVADAIDRAAAAGRPVDVLDARTFLRDERGGQVPDTGAGPAAQLWPHLHGTDAMFLSILQRRV